MTHRDADAAWIAHELRRMHGLDLSPYDPPFLRDTLMRGCARAGAPTLAAYGRMLLESASERATLRASLSVPYSAFFRDPVLYADLERRLLPELVEEAERTGRSGLRVWSAGCASGEEPYSVAILLEDLAIRRDRAAAYRVFATDRDPAALDLAAAGRYGEPQLSGVRLGQLRAWFAPDAEGFRIAAGIRDRVDFSAHDLLDTRVAHPPAAIFGAFDLILCCNLLYYYNHETRTGMLRRLAEALRPGGRLALGETERDAAAGVFGLHSEGVRPGAFFRKVI